MVYCGRPSKACKHCRTRKLRCDLRKEGCGQCKRARLNCHGYRNTDQLRIRYQTHSVSQKLVKRRTKVNLTASISTSLKDRARTAFFSHYVFHGSKSYDFLGQFYTSSNIDEPLSTSLDATSLAFFAHQEHAMAASKEGRDRYGTALTRVRQALTCIASAKKDSTLFATMVLDLYEKITNFNPRFDHSWQSHAQGSLALVGLRGPQLFQDRNEFRMLVRLSTNLLITCVATDTPPSADLISLRKHASARLDMKDPKWLLTDLMLHYVSLREAISKGQLSDRDIIASLYSLNVTFLNLAVNSPDPWQCRQIQIQDPNQRVLGDHIDCFLDHHITQTHNVSRLTRILLNELLYEYSTIPAGLAFSYEKGFALRIFAEETITQLVDEICASAPQYLIPELVESQPVPFSPISVTSIERDSNGISTASARVFREYTSAEKVRAYTLIFPLYIAGQSIGSTLHQKLWIIDQLHFMASAMGTKNAEVMAQILEAGSKLDPWKVYAMLGSYAFAA